MHFSQMVYRQEFLFSTQREKKNGKTCKKSSKKCKQRKKSFCQFYDHKVLKMLKQSKDRCKKLQKKDHQDFILFQNANSGIEKIVIKNSNQ